MEKKITRIPEISGHYSLIRLRDLLSEIQGFADVKIDVTTQRSKNRRKGTG
jgi:hypothetical protein